MTVARSEMAAIFLQSFLFFFFFCVLLNSGSSIAEKLPPEGTRQSRKLDNEKIPVMFLPSGSASQLDAAIPIVNPNPPSTETPIVMPEGPPPPTTTEPTNSPAVPVNQPPPTTTVPTNSPAVPVNQPPPTSTEPANPAPPTTAGSGGAWCVASPTASQTALQVALDYACGYGGTDCSAIQPGASCYNPNSLRDHASYAFNAYYQKNPVPTSCSFGGTAQLTYNDPSSGNCHYASPKTSTSTPTPTPPTMTTPTPPSPSTASPVNPYTPPVPSIYGSEPTASPSSADSTLHNLRVLFMMICLMLLTGHCL
ncbi:PLASMODESMATA CALLOSE-BINDING PROTEIN 1-like [Diospyros lotus]|uniref:PLASMODESMATA CALLOSE-BINDING PROTEIN 1-like n=1 Tax=Diospyros lotus TaxID=55363 RepID=UPI00224CFA05|nr:PLASMODESMATA CALLOSE-BINDING PROTEIN 1-like [Diospyros lotus]